MKPISRIVFGTLGAGVAALGIYLAVERSPAGERSATEAPKVTISDAPIARETKLTSSFAPIIKKVSPSVVNIYSTKIVKERPFMTPFDDPFFRRFFGFDFDDDPRGRGRPQTRQEQSLGSGVIVSEDGYILTNNHVVEGADEIKVVLADGRKEFEARIVGTDPQTEVAVLKVDGKNLQGITVADSDALEVGDVVLAIGNPFWVGQTVTMGIVSATGRSLGGRILGREGYEDFIQTDASINPGNSGGALVDAEGRLVGIPTFIISRSGGNQGVGFAVPINLARYVMDQIIAHGKVTRAFLGVWMQPITEELAREFGLPPDTSGVLVSQVIADSPAARAGLKEGDAIVEFNGKKVTDSPHLRLMVAQTTPKTRVTLKVLREGKEKMFEITLDEQKDQGPGSGLQKYSGSEPSGDTLDGVEVADLDARWRRQFDIPPNIRGAVVTSIEVDSPAYAQGVRVGDVILEIDRKPVRNADEAVELSKNLKGRVLLRVWSGGGTRFVVVDNSKRRRE
jgi:serine protease Do